MWGVGCGVWGVGCGVWGVGCGVWGVGGGDGWPPPPFQAIDMEEVTLGRRDSCVVTSRAALRFRVLGLGFRV
jgi:hypothetical protein